jgi:hypothetical protein
MRSPVIAIAGRLSTRYEPYASSRSSFEPI